jgi:hypothetical protein
LNNLTYSHSKFPSLVRKMTAFVLIAAMFGLTLMFSILLVGVVLAAGAISWGYLWWKTDKLRKQIGIHTLDAEVTGTESIKGEVIEGEVVYVEPGDGK